ncbi:MAG: TatD family hydrolase [Ferruginibacter sp.]
MTDTHCHLYSGEFGTDTNAMINRALDAGINSFFMPAIDSSTHTAMLALEDQYPGKCFSMMGLHPCSVKENYLDELGLLEDWLQKRNFAAIGETGLDFYWDKSYVKEQYAALEAQTTLAIRYDLPLVLHTRNAMQETIDFIRQYRGSGLKGIFHCFGGTAAEAGQITEAGFLLGIGGVVTYKKSGLHQVLKEVDLQHIVLETDAPYLSPVPYRGKRNESSYLGLVAEKIAEIKGTHVQEVIGVTDSNARKIFHKSFIQIK